MRHERDLRQAGVRATRTERLFELHRQETLQTGRGRAYPGPEGVRPDIALRLREKAMRSLRSGQSGAPRKPVATTNFSELSARDAGGFTFATFVKRCFKSF